MKNQKNRMEVFGLCPSCGNSLHFENEGPDAIIIVGDYVEMNKECPSCKDISTISLFSAIQFNERLTRFRDDLERLAEVVPFKKKETVSRKKKQRLQKAS